MATHDILFEIPRNEVINQDLIVRVRSNGSQLGELTQVIGAG